MKTLREYIAGLEVTKLTLDDLEFSAACAGVSYRSRRELAAELRAAGWEPATNGRERSWFAPGAVRYTGTHWVSALVALVKSYAAERDEIEPQALYEVITARMPDVADEAISRANTMLREKMPDWYIDRAAKPPVFLRR